LVPSGNRMRGSKFRKGPEVSGRTQLHMSETVETSSGDTASPASQSGVPVLPRRRAKRVDVRIAHKAMEAALPINERIGPWQARAAHLLAVAEKLNASGRNNPGIAAEVDELIDAVADQEECLAARLRELPADVAASTRLEDTQRALASIAGILKRARTLLAVRRGG
jgi:hypothetical protein